jgi:spore maturation protein CgeB
MKVLYVGDLTIGGTALQRPEALKDIGHELTLVDTALPLNGLVGVTNRGVRKLFGHALDFAGANRSALEVVASKYFEVVWVDKGLAIRPETLREIRERSRGARIIACSPDDMSGRHNQSPRYLACLPADDVHVTTKSFNVPELYRDRSEAGGICGQRVRSRHAPAPRGVGQ